jgi:hypothetical protein
MMKKKKSKTKAKVKAVGRSSRGRTPKRLSGLKNAARARRARLGKEAEPAEVEAEENSQERYLP